MVTIWPFTEPLNHILSSSPGKDRGFREKKKAFCRAYQVAAPHFAFLTRNFAYQ